MFLIIHRGTKEIGGSCVEIEYDDCRIVIDIGLPLVDENGKRFELPSRNPTRQELLDRRVLPSVEGLYAEENAKPIDALLISHAHMDHYGLGHYVQKKIPKYMGAGTKKLIDISAEFIRDIEPIENTDTIENEIQFDIGPFKITPYLTDHSAYDAYSFLIEAGGKRLFYSGDFRGHGRKWKLFQKFLSTGPTDVDCLLMEGTTLGRSTKKMVKEDELEIDFMNVFKESKGLVMVISSSQNIDRLVTVFRAVKRADRQWAIDNYTAKVLESLNELNPRLPQPSKSWEIINVFYPFAKYVDYEALSKEDEIPEYKEIRIGKKTINLNPDKYVMMIRPSMLRYLGNIDAVRGSTIIYSMWDGYLKEPGFQPFHDFIKKKNINMIKLHTSGHAGLSDLKKFAKKLNPKRLIPIHTFKADEYKEHFDNVLIVNDGEKFEV